MRQPRTFVSTAILFASLSTCGSALGSDPNEVVWSPDWPRVRLSEKLGLIPLAATSLAFVFLVPAPEHARWRGGILLDDWVRRGLGGRTLSTQRAAQRFGTYVYYGAVPTVMLVDVALVTLGIHRSADVALQMLLIDLQALGMSGVVSLGAEQLVGRQRPYGEDCGPDGQARTSSGVRLYNTCGGPNDNKSFIAGHAAAVATMAGLTCAHHQHLPLYGGGLGDLAPCVLMMGAATFTGVTRIVADKHWASDVVLGWSVGALSGYVVPSLLHYGFTSDGPLGAVHSGSLMAVPIPMVYPGGAGLGFAGFL